MATYSALFGSGRAVVPIRPDNVTTAWPAYVGHALFVLDANHTAEHDRSLEIGPLPGSCHPDGDARRATPTFAWPEFDAACVFFDSFRWMTGSLDD